MASQTFALMKWMQPLPKLEHGLVVLIAIGPAGLIFLSGIAPWFNEIVLAVMLGIYIVLRGYRTYQRYQVTPYLEVHRHVLSLPYSLSKTGRPLILDANDVERIDFYRGLGSMRTLDTSMVITDRQGNRYRISAFNLYLEEPKAALERLGWPVHSNPNPLRIPFYTAAFGFIAAVLYWLFFDVGADPLLIFK